MRSTPYGLSLGYFDLKSTSQGSRALTWRSHHSNRASPFSLGYDPEKPKLGCSIVVQSSAVVNAKQFRCYARWSDRQNTLWRWGIILLEPTPGHCKIAGVSSDHTLFGWVRYTVANTELLWEYPVYQEHRSEGLQFCPTLVLFFSLDAKGKM